MTTLQEPKMTSVEMQKYFDRIGFAGPAKPSLEVLRRLHTCHLLSVPFENLTVHSGGRVQLDLHLLYDKIVNHRRGGFCYENNSLFRWMLTELGFQVTILSGQVKNRFTGRYGPPFDHFILLVELEGRRWLCDVGFSSPSYSVPLSLDTEDPQEQDHRVYRIRKDVEMYFLEWQEEENRGVDGDWKEIYKFTLKPRSPEDFKEMCQYHQTSPSSLHFCKSLCTVLRRSGRLTYIGHKLITTTFPTEESGHVVETITELKDEEIPGVLKEKFGIVLNSPLIVKDEEITPPPITY